MKQTLTFIALRMTPISDRKAILNAYSREAGRVAFVVALGASKDAVRRRALLQPLSVVEGVADRRVGSDLMTLTQTRAVAAYSRLYSHPVKNAIAQFVTELLSLLLREVQPDAALFDYISLAIATLADASTRQAANFHICFLMHLGRMFGIDPDWSTYRPGYLLDLDEGRFVTAATTSRRVLTPEESLAALRLSRMTFANAGHFRFTRQQRNAAIDLILSYISTHYAPITTLHSLEILRSLF